MSYNFGMLNFGGFLKAKQWLKGGVGPYVSGKPNVDNAVDNNYQNYSDNAAGTGAIPTYKELNASNQFEVNAGHALVDGAFTLNAVAVPATPTAVVNGTVGATTYTYKVVGRAGNLQAPSATVSKTTGNATLSAINSITLTFVPTAGFLTYDIYRTAGGATQGMIGSVLAAFGVNVLTPTLTFTDTGIRADGSTSPTVNTTGAVAGDLVVYGNITPTALATPATPLITPQGTVGATTWTYKIVARSGSPTTATGRTAASAAGSTTTGNATLTSVNSNLIAWQPVPGATSYDVYRTVGGATQGLIGSTAGRTFTDTGLAGDSSTAPTTNTTGVLNASGASSPTFGVTPNYIATETGANNAIAGALVGAALVAGLTVTVKLAHTLQIGANTFNLNAGGALAIKSSRNSATDLATAYAATGVIDLFYNGALWQDLSQ